MELSSFKGRSWRIAAAGGLVGLAASVAPIAATSASATTASPTISTTGLPAGAIKHVWLIILENKSYDATFTGLNNNTYLWQTLPSQGVLLKNYYGTGHFSLDNYTSLVSGQGPAPADQNDCPIYQDMTGSVLSTSDVNNGQFSETGTPYATATTNSEGKNGGTGCVYPASVPTLFNQFDAAGVSWKGYAQDLGNADASGPTHDVNACGGPGANPATTPVTNPGGANATDQYVPKHFPFPWFESLLNSGGTSDCNSGNIASLFSPTNGLYHDLQSESTTPAFSWISPNNCSDAHDAICAGNNLSGGFSDPNTPNPPTNYTGGLYASDLFLQHVVPEIEASPAFKDGGLIDVTFDEANPPYANMSFNNSSTPASASRYAQSDTAGQSFISAGTVTNSASEPAGPNTPNLVDSQGNQVYPGPGDSAFIDRPSSLSGDTTNDPLYVKGGGGSVPGARTDSNGVSSSGSTVVDPSILAPDAGRGVSGTGIPANACVGPVSDTGPRFDTAATGSSTATNPANKAYNGSFTVVDCTTQMADTVSGVTSVTLAAETSSTDPLFSSTIPTPGGGDTGSILISPYIKGGTSTTTDYNHYSWLRTMEDLFNVSSGSSTSAISGGSGSVSGGIDGLGHLGFAAQANLNPFGPDVFSDPTGQSGPGNPGTPLPESPLAVGLPVAGMLLAGGVVYMRRRRSQVSSIA